MQPEAASSSEQPQEECSWCRFMKGGPCKAVFEVWQTCIDATMSDTSPESRKAAIDTCADVTGPLFECMVKHPGYYGPQLAGMPSEKPSTTGDSATSQSGREQDGTAAQAKPAVPAQRTAEPAAAAAVGRAGGGGVGAGPGHPVSQDGRSLQWQSSSSGGGSGTEGDVRLHTVSSAAS